MKKKNKEPNVREMKAFSRRFKKEQWELCCESDAFVQACLTDIRRAEQIGARILINDWDGNENEYE